MISAEVTDQFSTVTGPVFSLRDLSTDLKNTDFHFYRTYSYIKKHITYNIT